MDEISHHDRTKSPTHINRPISTQLHDLGRGHKKAGRAKYSIFSAFVRFSAFALFIVAGLSIPSASVHARAFSYSAVKNKEAITSPIRTEAQYSQTIDLLESAINIDPIKAMGGGYIIMDDMFLYSDMGLSGTNAEIEARYHQGKVSLYVVHSGDTIAQVAKMFGVSVNTILWANDISRGATLQEGQYLVILPIDGVQHTVKNGETIGGIAKKYGGNVDEIMEFNDMVATTLLVGDVIIIPGGAEPTNSGTAVISRSRVIAAYPSYAGYYTHPVPAARRRSQSIHGYNGVDYSASIGTPVYAAAEGTVIVSRFRADYCGRYCGGGYGNYIVIAHPNGTQTLYGHLSSVYTTTGVHVDKGQWIGEVGNTGKSTGAHLHFEVRGGKNPGADGNGFSDSWSK